MRRLKLHLPRLRWPSASVRAALIVLFVLMPVLMQDTVPYGEQSALLARVVQGRAFDFVGWEFDALRGKFAQNTAGTQDWLDEEQRKALVREYFASMGQVETLESKLNDYYARAGMPGADAAAAAGWRAQLDALRAQQDAQQPFVEAILEEQISGALADLGFGPSGGVLPPVSVHFTPLPQMLVISPRDRIMPLYQVSLEHGLSIEQQEALERQADSQLGDSALVVPIGGLAMYPAMLLETSSFSWVVEASAHEWTHHWLALHPLGYEYDSNPQTRAINETVASIAGQEVAAEMLRRYYPETLAPQPAGKASGQGAPAKAAPFDYNKEMNDTRVHVDALLKQGKVDQAEAYMEARRRIFVANGYAIRKLNQAYFAFYGGYQAQPGGAAGEDPIGPAVRELRARSGSLKAFLDTVSGVTNLAELRAALKNR